MISMKKYTPERFNDHLHRLIWSIHILFLISVITYTNGYLHTSPADSLRVFKASSLALERTVTMQVLSKWSTETEKRLKYSLRYG
jgi:hypothetical protein